MDPIHTATGAFVAGLATSLHCAGMCGPISCSLMSLKEQDEYWDAVKAQERREK